MFDINITAMMSQSILHVSAEITLISGYRKEVHGYISRGVNFPW